VVIDLTGVNRLDTELGIPDKRAGHLLPHDASDMDTEEQKWIEQLRGVATWEFTNAADFVWKTPTFVELQKEIELQKSHEYFPNDERMRALRWRIESRKLKHVFPSLIASGNLFNILSLFEVYLLQLAFALEKFSQVRLCSASGQGTQRIFNYLRLIGLKPLAASPRGSQNSARLNACIWGS
jgi:hypothetical protein